MNKNCKIALLSSFTINGLGETLKVLCNNHDINAEIYNSNYNQYAQDILNKSSKLYEFAPDIIFLLIDIKHLFGEMYDFPYRIDSQQRKENTTKKFEEIKNLINLLKQNTKSKIIVNSFLTPVYSSRGILENKQDYGLREAVKNLNYMLEDLVSNDSQIFMFDYNLFLMKKGYDEVIDNKMDYLADMKISPKALIFLAEEYLSYIFPLMSMTKKCIVLDLDNTLWGGVIGEEGISNIKLGPEKEGRPFLDFQKKLLGLSERGIILAINSKNNYEDALNVIKNHPYMLLREEKFASIKINWEDKIKNLLEIANELNIGLDSIVFFDDDKMNQALVKEMLPEVFVVEMPDDPSDYARVIENLKIFNSFTITKEDIEKQNMYLSQKRREELNSNISDLQSFLRELKLKITIKDINDFDIPRASQLTQKTNQFNLTTKRYTEEDIANFAKDENYILKQIQVKDRFGDYGITGLAIIKKENPDAWMIDTFLLSCRILGKNIEFAFLQEIINEAQKQNIHTIHARFISTPKNAPAANFLKEAGFIRGIGSEIYSLKVGEENKKDINAKIENVNP